MRTLQRTIKNFNLQSPYRFDVPLSQYTTFRVGGPAEVMAEPRTTEELAELLAVVAENDLPVTILGGGANVVVADAGIPGVVVFTGALNHIEEVPQGVSAGAGSAVSDVSAFAADHDRPGFDWIYAMPGTTGGAVWMNARCYGGEIAEVLVAVDFVDVTGRIGRYRSRSEDFAYKRSPFQDGRRVITAVEFALGKQPGSSSALWQRMRSIEDDRRQKGHFDAPCAGSIFKNDRAFGEPSGKIIDRVGLRGLRRGGAQVSPGHGNIIINTGDATAREIRDLVTEVQDRVYRTTGYFLDPEVLFLGDWA